MTDSSSGKAATTTSLKKSTARTERILLWLLLIGCGVITGLFVPQNGMRSVLAQWLNGGATATVEAEEDDSHEDPEGVFMVTIAAQQTYGVEVAKAKPGKYTQHISVPAFIRERPTVSNLRASSRLQGVVRRIFVQVGQSVREGDPLVELELTGDELASAQAVLLDSVQQLQILDDEIARLQPAAQAGGIAKKSLIEKQYELRRMKSVVESKRQELLVRGLTTTDVSGIIQNRQLVRTVVIRVPSGIRPENVGKSTQLAPIDDNSFRLVSQRQALPTAKVAADEWVYSVEMMNVSPGSVLTAGADVCDLAYHETLLIEGQAYERDLSVLNDIIRDRRPVSVSVGESADPVVLEDFRILFMDNHVDNETQTYRFYIDVPNSVLTENIVESNQRFRTWRFKPGQRGHVRLPQKEWTDRLILPAEAVVQDGVDHVVFRELGQHFHEGEPPHSDFQKIVVKVDYEDQHTVVVDAQKQLKIFHKIAMNNADMLLRAMKAAAGGSGGGHDHHGHSH